MDRILIVFGCFCCCRCGLLLFLGCFGCCCSKQQCGCTFGGVYVPGIYSHARSNVPLVHCMYLFHMAGEVYLWWSLCTLHLLACHVTCTYAEDYVPCAYSHARWEYRRRFLALLPCCCAVFQTLINSPYLVGPVLRFPDTTVPQPFYCKWLTLKTWIIALSSEFLPPKKQSWSSLIYRKDARFHNWNAKIKNENNKLYNNSKSA